MKNQESCLDVKKFLEWREQLTDALNYRRETVIELLDWTLDKNKMMLA